MKTYVITVSRNFPSTHNKKGEPTHFVEKIFNELKLDYWKSEEFLNPFVRDHKIHTIRANYTLWEKRIKEVQEGKAILSLRYWSGKPYNSKQIEFAKLDKDSGCGIQRIEFINQYGIVEFNTIIDIDHLAENDGLSLDDYNEWFRKYDLSKPMAIIHFTKFRY